MADDQRPTADDRLTTLARESPAVLQALRQINVPLWVFDVDRMAIVWANPLGVTLWGANSLAELQRRDFSTDMSSTVRRRLLQYREDFLRDLTFFETWTIYPHGEPQTYHCRFSGFLTSDASLAVLIQAVTKTDGKDVTSLRSTHALLHTSVMISLYDWDGKLLYCNPAARTRFGAGYANLEQRLCDASAFDALRNALDAGGECRDEREVNTVAGKRWHALSLQRGLDAVTGAPTMLISETDVTERRAAERLANQLAYSDVLTGLPNRTMLLERLDAELSRADRYRRGLAVLFLDLDRFKHVNDSLGHAVGDQLLIEVARRLSACVRKSNTVARFGGDEFVVIVNDAADDSEVVTVVERILHSVVAPVVFDRQELQVSTSIGISRFPSDGGSADELMKNADVAMYQAKARGRNAYCFFTAQMTATADSRLRLENDLRRALTGDEFDLYYQPRVSVRTGAVVGAEALLRWRHPQRGLLLPDSFIPLAEEIGVIGEIGDWVIRRATRQLASWRDQGLAVRLSVNLSAQQLGSRSLTETVADALARAGVVPALLELEITESMLMGNDGRVLDVLGDLHRLGVRLAIDDFGTGYSNLGYLGRYPIDCLKIDRSFVTPEENWPIAEMIITLGRMMNLTLVAEGVEQRPQLDWLARNGCDEYQGFYFSEAVVAEQFERLCRSLVEAGR